MWGGEWSKDALYAEEAPFAEVADKDKQGGDACTGKNFAEMYEQLDGNMPATHVVDTPWSFSSQGDVDKEGYAYTTGGVTATDWTGESSMACMTRRRTWYRVAHDPAGFKGVEEVRAR